MRALISPTRFAIEWGPRTRLARREVTTSIEFGYTRVFINGTGGRRLLKMRHHGHSSELRDALIANGWLVI
ncbi:MAG TPA: hypothetical protein VE172_11085 [Stackebrandtia sp.]|uniref:hypothetical protein n=1 Tax=Stackebrandtia sp. TaxID=2023065 RepID=UPI002D64076C|nr:hypothetical protein [Stackebrandtia sp.]HZE39344.1 hypothetical protein [Stackebrandtia sp.]